MGLVEKGTVRRHCLRPSAVNSVSGVAEKVPRRKLGVNAVTGAVPAIGAVEIT